MRTLPPLGKPPLNDTDARLRWLEQNMLLVEQASHENPQTLTDGVTFTGTDVVLGTIDGGAGVEIPMTAAGRALAALGTAAADKIAYFTSATVAAFTTLTSFARTLLDDTTAGAALTTLGVSSFAQTVLDDTTAGAALTTLGVSSFAQTVLDDTTALAARATLGANGNLFLETRHTGSGTHTFHADTINIEVEVQAAGGAGGGSATASVPNASAGEGGAGGNWARKFFPRNAITTATITIGAAGVAASGAAGGNAANSSYADGVNTLTVPGGPGGALGSDSTNLVFGPGTAAGSLPTGGDVNLQGGDGGSSMAAGTDVSTVLNAIGGVGGRSRLGGGTRGGRARGTASNGVAGIVGKNYGGGGSGGGFVHDTSGANAGGNGGPAIIIVREFK